MNAHTNTHFSRLSLGTVCLSKEKSAAAGSSSFPSSTVQLAINIKRNALRKKCLWCEKSARLPRSTQLSNHNDMLPHSSNGKAPQLPLPLTLVKSASQLPPPPALAMQSALSKMTRIQEKSKSKTKSSAQVLVVFVKNTFFRNRCQRQTDKAQVHYRGYK